jgi:hypothetical protein
MIAGNTKPASHEADGMGKAAAGVPGSGVAQTRRYPFANDVICACPNRRCTGGIAWFHRLSTLVIDRFPRLVAGYRLAAATCLTSMRWVSRLAYGRPATTHNQKRETRSAEGNKPSCRCS